MNKYMRAKKFNQYKNQNKYRRYDRSDAALEKKEFRQYCAVIFILLLCTVFCAICIHWNLFGVKDWYQRNPQAKADPVYTDHVVKPNETLWSIAENYRPNEDTRKIVYEIRKANASRSGERLDPNILPGQVIRVPE